MSQTQKTAAQIHCETLARRRKPLIDFSKKTETEALKAKDEEIASLARQLRQTQEQNTAKEALIRELEDKLAAALAPKTAPQIEKTEEIPGTTGRRRRQQVEPPPFPAPSDGISEED